jgi:hypothetical protein
MSIFLSYKVVIHWLLNTGESFNTLKVGLGQCVLSWPTGTSSFCSLKRGIFGLTEEFRV